jgi:membrane protease YdiL (CAAX protease family)
MHRGRLVLEMLLVFSTFFLPGYLSQAAMTASAAPDPVAAMLQVIAFGIPQLLLMVYLVSVQPDGSLDHWGIVALQPRDGAQIALLLACSMAVILGFMGLLRLLPPHWAGLLYRGYRWGLGRPSQIPLAVLFGLTVGYREEFFFRAYLLRRLDQAGMPSWAAIALSTALFSAGHLYEGIIGIALAACLGALFSLVYLRQRSLHVIAIGHGLYNALALCLGLFEPLTRAIGAR